MSLCDGEKSRSRDGGAGNGFSAGCIDYVLGTYGARRLFAELDSGRTYETGTILDSLLNYISGEGFVETFERYDAPYRSALEYRNRYLLEALKR
jgi:hypothetical protein